MVPFARDGARKVQNVGSGKGGLRTKCLLLDMLSSRCLLNNPSGIV